MFSSYPIISYFLLSFLIKPKTFPFNYLIKKLFSLPCQGEGRGGVFGFLLLSIPIFLISYFYSQPLAAVLPHHDFVKSTRTKFFSHLKLLRPFIKTIIIIGPDHFSPYQNQLFYTDQPWFYDSKPLNFASSLYTEQPWLFPTLQSLLQKYDSLVQRDHTISSLLPDLAHFYPRAKIFPILIGSQVTTSSLDTLASTLTSICGSNCLLLASVDFSHYLPYSLADIHDLTSLSALETQNLKKILSLEVDSPASLYVLAKFSASKSAKLFKLLAHTNSSKLVNNSDIESTSHIFGFYRRSLFNFHHSQPLTFLLTPSLNPQNSPLLGSRFFYGTDLVSYNLSQKLLDNLNLPLIFDPHIAIAGSYQKGKYILQILPLDLSSSPFLLRGDKKQNFLSSYFSHLDPQEFSSFDPKTGFLSF